MAYNNKIIYNPAIRQQIKFVQTGRDTNGALLQMIASYGPQSTKPAPHYHPHQEEEFSVLSGILSIEIDGEVRTLEEGETLQIPSNTVHAMWNASDKDTVMQWKVKPALNTEHLLETLSGLARDGKTNSAGIPSLLQVVLIARKFSNAFRLAKPSYTVQQIAFTLLAPFSYLLGYKEMYKKYID